MKKTISQDCPLCGNDAAFYFVDSGQRKYFRCVKCANFLITRRAESRLAKGSDEWRGKLSKLPAQPVEGYVLDIYIPSPVNSEETPALASRYIPKADF